MVHTGNKIDAIRGDVINSILSATLFLVPLAASAIIIRSSNTGWLPSYYLNLLIILIIFVMALFRNRVDVQIKSIGFIVCLMMLGTSVFFQNGLLSFGPLCYLTCIGLATIFFNKHGVLAVVFTTLIMTAVVSIFTVSSGNIPSYDVTAYLTSPAAWVSTSLILLILGIVFIFALVKYNASLIKSLADTIASERLANHTKKVALVAMADLAEYRDNDTGEHVLRVARMTHEIARTLIRRGVKPDDYGEHFLKHIEHWDGAGYPGGLRGTDIPLSARIVAVADVYDALTTKRPYKEPWSTEKALAYIRERSGSQFDSTVVEAFFEVQTMRSHAPTVAWSDQIAIGHPILDQDHRILLELVNQIANPENTKDRAAIKFVIDEVVNYTYFHFNREEQFMAAAGYPDIDRHCKIHASMVAEVKLMQQRFDEQGENIGSELSRFLNEWLINHIMKIDKEYGPYVVNTSNEASSVTE